jgi:hypothetical protein
MNEHERNESVSISIIKFVSDRAEVERKLTDTQREALKELIFSKFTAHSDAQVLAYTELQRRLEVLNHAHQEQVKDKEHYSMRDT